MKKLTTILAAFLFIFLLAGTAYSQDGKATKKFKKYVNRMVQKVEQAETPSQKRTILDDSFEKFLTVFDHVQNMEIISESDKVAIGKLEKMVIEKKRELNGEGRFSRVPDSQLDNFANYVQQDLEQADTVITISATTLLLIIIILLLI